MWISLADYCYRRHHRLMRNKNNPVVKSSSVKELDFVELFPRLLEYLDSGDRVGIKELKRKFCFTGSVISSGCIESVSFSLQRFCAYCGFEWDGISLTRIDAEFAVLDSKLKGYHGEYVKSVQGMCHCWKSGVEYVLPVNCCYELPDDTIRTLPPVVGDVWCKLVRRHTYIDYVICPSGYFTPCFTEFCSLGTSYLLDGNIIQWDLWEDMSFRYWYERDVEYYANRPNSWFDGPDDALATRLELFGIDWDDYLNEHPGYNCLH